MRESDKKTSVLLNTFGLDPKEIVVYLELYHRPWQTVVNLAQVLDIPRPTLYRILQQLEKQGLIENSVDHKTTYYSVTPVSSFQNKIIESKKHTQQLESSFMQLSNLLSLTSQQEHLKTSVNFYRGKNSIKSMEWQIIEEQPNETCILGNDLWWKYLGQDFAEETRRERLRLQLRNREILNPEHRPRLEKPWTQVHEYLELHSARYIDRSVLPIDNELMITDKSVYMYSFTELEIVGIKIQSPVYAQTMKGLFELAWKLAVP